MLTLGKILTPEQTAIIVVAGVYATRTPKQNSVQICP